MRRKEESPIKQHLKAVANHYIQRMQNGENITSPGIAQRSYGC